MHGDKLKTNKASTNKNGQRHTMKGTTGGKQGSTWGNSSSNRAIDPTSTLGHNCFDKQGGKKK